MLHFKLELRQCLRINEILDRHLDVATYLAQQARSQIATAVHRDRGDSAIGMPELLMRAALTYFDKPESLQARDYCLRLEYGD